MRRRTCLLVLLVMTCLPAAPAAAGAGSYQVSACNQATGAVNNAWEWGTSDASQPSHFAEHQTCPFNIAPTLIANQEGGLSTTDALELASGAPPETSADWSATAPAGTTITAINYERFIGHTLDGNNSWSPALRADGTIVPGESCLDTVQNNETCAVGGPPGEGGEPHEITGLQAHQLTLGITCQAPAEEECITGAGQHAAWATMYGSTITLNDPSPPTLDTPTGTLWSSGPDQGFHKGIENLAISAEDLGGGVKNITLTADGHPIAAYNPPCHYTFMQPCPTSTGPQTMTIPTTALPDGTHTLTLLATDAAGNQSPALTEQITTDNTPPAPPTNLHATPTPSPNLFTANWEDPAGQTAPITTATYQLCPTNGGTCTTPITAPATGPATITTPGPGTWNLAVWLTDAAGNGTPTNAANTVLTTSASPGNGTTSGTPTNATIRVSARLIRRELVVHVSGHGHGLVRVHFSATLHHKTVAVGTRHGTLKPTGLTESFKLGPRTATRALITITAALVDERPVATHPPRRTRTTQEAPPTTPAISGPTRHEDVAGSDFGQNGPFLHSTAESDQRARGNRSSGASGLRE